MIQKNKDKMIELKLKIKQYSYELGLDESAIQKGNSLIENYMNRFSTRNNTDSLAAGVVYISSILVGNRKTQNEICKISKVSRGSLRKNYKKLGESIDLDILL